MKKKIPTKALTVSVIISLILLFPVCSTGNNRNSPRYVDMDSVQNVVSSDTITTVDKKNSNSYFAIGRGGSYGSIGLKVGRYKIKNNRLQAGYVIGGLGAYTNSTETEYGLGILASYGRKYYFPDVFFLDGRVGIQEYAYQSGSFLPVPGVKLIAGFEARGRRMGFSIGAGISQNLLFDYTTRPVIELGFIFGKWDLPKKNNQ